MFSVIKATFVRNTIAMYRAYPWSFFLGHILTGVYTVLFAYFTYTYVFKGSLDPRFKIYAGSNDYLSYVILGGALYSFAVSTLMNVSRSLITEYREGTLEGLLISPFSRKGYFIGNVTQQIMRTSLEFIIIVTFGLIFGLDLSKINIFGAILIWVLSIFSFFCQALFLGSIMLYFRDTYISQNTLFFIMSFVSGVTFPVAYLPDWIKPLSYIMPLFPSLTMFRSVVIEGQLISLHINDVIHLLVLSITYLFIGSISIKHMEKRIIEQHY
ncbi:ABC transporter [Brevibacillus panacihumi W25]|uniref:Transport permease protein n=1 Tax=Brevibacillus panacihumi W25 TaxID=1408254 RepID=V6LZK7_9BACL|nr:ABC transporter permease [Brevibacillus panacihumi]EST51572.1 ABC transporter [Brevibacillus panacihumi W25]